MDTKTLSELFVSRAEAVHRRRRSLVVVALPFAYRDGMDEYKGVMRYLRETKTPWNLRIVRHSFCADTFAGFPVDDVAGVICGMNSSEGISGYEAKIPGSALEFLARNGIPVVGVDIPLKPLVTGGKRARQVFLSLDSEMIGRKAAQYFVSAGEYESFGFVGMFSDCVWSRDRGASFVRELRRTGKRCVSVFRGDARSREDGLAEWIVGLAKPAAVFATNDHCAAIVMKTCTDLGIRVPHEVAVLGVDDDPIFCIHTSPTLSSLHPDFEAEGYHAAKVLAALIARRRPPKGNVVCGTVTVTERMSTAPSSYAGKLVRRADEIIAEHACSALKTDIVADMLGISRRLLDMRYRQFRGRSVHEAIESARLAEARRLLLSTHLSHREIARSCAFNSDSYLERVFQRRFGQTMREFRKSGGGENQT